MNREELNKDQSCYLTISERDVEWGIVVSTVGSQSINPRSAYPPTNHPKGYSFIPQSGRILSEYQLVYITKGRGVFTSKSCPTVEVEAGSIIFLFPNEWHSYEPDSTTGWEECWVGFKGEYIDERIKNGFFSKDKPIHKVGISSLMTDLYEDIFYHASKEERGCQQIVSSLVLHILGIIYYKERNSNFSNSDITDKINEARVIMKNSAHNPLPIEEIAHQLNVGYTWFRRMFKDYTGVSPAQYQIQQRIMLAKELLTTTDLKVAEIAYRLNFESGGQFSTFFKKREGITPTDFRDRMQ